MPSHDLDQAHDIWIIRSNTIRNRCRHPHHFLQHFDVCVLFVFAGFDLSGFHAEGSVEFHSLSPDSVISRRERDIEQNIKYLEGIIEICCVNIATHFADSTVAVV